MKDRVAVRWAQELPEEPRVWVPRQASAGQAFQA